MKIKVVYTDGSQPIGNGVGPALEAADVISVLKGDGPNDLRVKSVYLATEMLKMVGIKNAKDKVLEVLDSNKAYDKFIEIIVAQGGSKYLKLPSVKHSYDIKSKISGKVNKINNKLIAKIARAAGAPSDLAAGIYLRVKKNDKVKKGDTLFTIYSKSKSKLENAIIVVKDDMPIMVQP